MSISNGRILALVVFGTAALAMGACENTAEGVKQDAAKAQEKAAAASEDAAQKAQEAADTTAAAAKEAAGAAGEAVSEGAKDAAQKAGKALESAGRAISGATETVDVKAALMADKAVDASHIDVDTDAGAKTVTLKGTVPLASQKTWAEAIAKKNAPTYRIINKLEVAAK